MNEPSKPTKKPSFIKLFFKAAAAAFGVQSHKNLEEDFSQQSAIPYIAVGVVFTLLVVISLIAIVSAVV